MSEEKIIDIINWKYPTLKYREKIELANSIKKLILKNLDITESLDIKKYDHIICKKDIKKMIEEL